MFFFCLLFADAILVFVDEVLPPLEAFRALGSSHLQVMAVGGGERVGGIHEFGHVFVADVVSQRVAKEVPAEGGGHPDPQRIIFVFAKVLLRKARAAASQKNHCQDDGNQFSHT